MYIPVLNLRQFKTIKELEMTIHKLGWWRHLYYTVTLLDYSIYQKPQKTVQIDLNVTKFCNRRMQILTEKL